MEFDKYLTELPDLNDTITSHEIPSDQITRLQLEANNLSAKYLSEDGQYKPSSPQSFNVSQITKPDSTVIDNVSDTSVHQEQVTPTTQSNHQNVSQTEDLPPFPTPVGNVVTSEDNETSSQSDGQHSPQAFNTSQITEPDSSVPSCMGNLNLKDKKCLICAYTIKCRNVQKSGE